MAEIWRSPVEVGSWNPIIYKDLYIPGGDRRMSESSTVFQSQWWPEFFSLAFARGILPNDQAFQEFAQVANKRIIQLQRNFISMASIHRDMFTYHIP